jgi:hypothetical protein
MVAIKTDVVKEFRAFEKENGPSYIYGHILAPYSGCSYRNACAIVKGDYAYVTADLCNFSLYRQYVATTPGKIDRESCTVGCIRLEDIESVLREPEGRGLEFHSLENLAPNVPHALVGQVLDMCRELGYESIVEGQFRCPLCEKDLLNAERLEYLESEFRGNGGVGIEVGAPVCCECYHLHKCPNCGGECEPLLQDVDEKDHCIYCAPKVPCSRCGETMDLSWGATEADIEGYLLGYCGDCHTENIRAEEENDKYRKVLDASGTLFP